MTPKYEQVKMFNFNSRISVTHHSHSHFNSFIMRNIASLLVWRMWKPATHLLEYALSYPKYWYSALKSSRGRVSMWCSEVISNVWCWIVNVDRENLRSELTQMIYKVSSCQHKDHMAPTTRLVTLSLLITMFEQPGLGLLRNFHVKIHFSW